MNHIECDRNTSQKKNQIENKKMYEKSTKIIIIIIEKKINNL